jgi:ABC-2 type transport system permease protein
MKRVWFVARREFITNIKRRSFLFTAFGVPLLLIMAQFAIGYFAQKQNEATGTLGQIGYVDLSHDRVLDSAVDKPDEFRAFADKKGAQAALVSGEIGAFFIVSADYVEHGIVHAYSIKDIPRGIQEQMSGFLIDNLLADWPAERAERLKDPSRLTISTPEGEKVIESDESVLVSILLPIIFAVVFMMSILTTSGFLLQGVVEEKENRLVEILITSITPLQMLWGKIVGLGALALVQITAWAVAGALVVSRGSGLWSGLDEVTVPAAVLVWGPVYLVLGYLLFGALLAGIGASVTSMHEAQQIASIVSLIAAMPMFLSVAFFNNANGHVPFILSLVPATAPVAMVMRLFFADVPLWQIGLSVLSLMLATFLVVWTAAQVFRVGLLLYGKRLGLRPLWHAVH